MKQAAKPAAAGTTKHGLTAEQVAYLTSPAAFAATRKRAEENRRAKGLGYKRGLKFSAR